MRGNVAQCPDSGLQTGRLSGGFPLPRRRVQPLRSRRASALATAMDLTPGAVTYAVDRLAASGIRGTVTQVATDMETVFAHLAGREAA